MLILILKKKVILILIIIIILSDKITGFTFDNEIKRS